VEFDKETDESSLAGIENVKSVKNINRNTWIIEAEGEMDIRPLIFAFAVNNHLTVLSMQEHESNLEDVFRHLTT
jgi:hypothetical protein